MLLGLAKSKCHDGPLIAVCAERLASQGADTDTQAAANSLWALSKMRWYLPGVYERLVAQLADQVERAQSQNISNALLACAEAGYYGPALAQLLDRVLTARIGSLEKWEVQHLSNALYAWASSCGQAGSQLPTSVRTLYDQLAGRLMNRIVSISSRSKIKEVALTQVWQGYQEAAYRNLPWAATALPPRLLQSCQTASMQNMQGLRRHITSQAWYKQLVAACTFTAAGCTITGATEQGSTYTHLVLQPRNSTAKVAVLLAIDLFTFQHPAGELNGTGWRVVSVLQRVYDAVVVVRLEEGALSPKLTDESAQLLSQALLLPEAGTDPSGKRQLGCALVAPPQSLPSSPAAGSPAVPQPAQPLATDDGSAQQVQDPAKRQDTAPAAALQPARSSTLIKPRTASGLLW